MFLFAGICTCCSRTTTSSPPRTGCSTRRPTRCPWCEGAACRTPRPARRTRASSPPHDRRRRRWRPSDREAPPEGGVRVPLPEKGRAGFFFFSTPGLYILSFALIFFFPSGQSRLNFCGHFFFLREEKGLLTVGRNHFVKMVLMFFSFFSERYHFTWLTKGFFWDPFLQTKLSIEM